jgi:hypothetical protein
MFSEWSTRDETLAMWYERGRSRKQALEKRADVGSREYLLSLLDRGRHRRDTDKSVMEERRSPISIATGRRGFLEENLSGSPKAEALAGAVVE